MLRIAFFIETLKEDMDGVSITMHQIIKRLPKDRVDAIFVTPHPPDNEIGFPVYECPYLNIPVSNKGYRFGLPGRMKQLKNILDNFQPHIIHFSSPSALANYAAKYVKGKNILLTSIFHTHFQSYAPYYFGFLPFAERILNPIAYRCLSAYRQCDMVLAPTPTIKKYLEEKDFVSDRVKVWGRGVNSRQYSPINKIKDYWAELPKDCRKVLFVSRLVNEKEIDTLMRVYQLLDKRRPDVKLIIVGEGPAEKRMRRKMLNALFAGKLTGKDLAHVYASADVFLFPSVTETFGNVILEAMASGLPVVAAAAGGPVDIIQTGITGVLVTPKKEEEFFTEIVRLLDNREYHHKIKQNAIDYARTQRWDDLVERLVEHYYELAGISYAMESDENSIIQLQTDREVTVIKKCASFE